MRYLLLMAAVHGVLLAQTIEGTWQGTLTPPNQNGEIRLVFKIDKNGDLYKGRFYNLENGRQFNLGAITLQGNALKSLSEMSGAVTHAVWYFARVKDTLPTRAATARAASTKTKRYRFKYQGHPDARTR